MFCGLLSILLIILILITIPCLYLLISVSLTYLIIVALGHGRFNVLLRKVFHLLNGKLITVLLLEFQKLLKKNLAFFEESFKWTMRVYKWRKFSVVAGKWRSSWSQNWLQMSRRLGLEAIRPSKGSGHALNCRDGIPFAQIWGSLSCVFYVVKPEALERAAYAHLQDHA